MEPHYMDVHGCVTMLEVEVSIEGEVFWWDVGSWSSSLWRVFVLGQEETLFKPRSVTSNSSSAKDLWQFHRQGSRAVPSSFPILLRAASSITTPSRETLSCCCNHACQEHPVYMYSHHCCNLLIPDLSFVVEENYPIYILRHIDEWAHVT